LPTRYRITRTKKDCVCSNDKNMNTPIIAPTDGEQFFNAPSEKTANAAGTIAVLIPCYNEELTITKVIKDFREELPQADIYVFDNNSTDQTAKRALRAGAKVYREKRQGKGYVVQSMFREVDADIYIMVDGDGTYPASVVHKLIAPIARGEADVVVGSRLQDECVSQFKVWNRLGNKFFLLLLNLTFQVRLTDMLSGYRVFSREFVKRIPIFGGGFEIETELTIKALERGYRIVEVPAGLGKRPTGSYSKIRILRDGVIIVNTILALLRDYKPLTFFGFGAAILGGLGVVLGLIVVAEFLETGFVSHVPTAIMAVGLVLSGMLSGAVGFIVHTVVRRFQEFDHQLRLLVDELASLRRSPNQTRQLRVHE
jgi:hypothetical protein